MDLMIFIPTWTEGNSLGPVNQRYGLTTWCGTIEDVESGPPPGFRLEWPRTEEASKAGEFGAVPPAEFDWAVAPPPACPEEAGAPALGLPPAAPLSFFTIRFPPGLQAS